MTAICCRLEQEARFGLQRLDGAAEGHEEGTGKENERKNDHKHNKGFFGSLHKSIWILDWVLCTYKQRNYEKNLLAQLSHNPLKTHSIDWRVHIIVHRLVCAFMPEGPVTESRQNDRHVCSYSKFTSSTIHHEQVWDKSSGAEIICTNLLLVLCATWLSKKHAHSECADVWLLREDVCQPTCFVLSTMTQGRGPYSVLRRKLL